MAPIQHLIIDQHSDWEKVITLMDGSEPMDLTDHSVIAQFKRSYTSRSSYDFISSIDENPETGRIHISLPGEVSAGIRPGRYVYDILIRNDITERFVRTLEGIMTLTPMVSVMETGDEGSGEDEEPPMAT